MLNQRGIEAVVSRIITPAVELPGMLQGRVEQLRIGRLISVVKSLEEGPFSDGSDVGPWGSVEQDCEGIYVDAHIPDELDLENSEEVYSLNLTVGVGTKEQRPHIFGSMTERTYLSGDLYAVGARFEADQQRVVEGRELLGKFISTMKLVRGVQNR